jgi:hypothetical protein
MRLASCSVVKVPTRPFRIVQLNGWPLGHTAHGPIVELTIKAARLAEPPQTHTTTDLLLLPYRLSINDTPSPVEEPKCTRLGTLCQIWPLVEMSGLEPLTSSVQRRRSPN